jgi:cyclin-dependent kinase 2
MCHFCRRVLGTPSEQSWPGVTSLQDWNSSFPVWPALNINKFVPDFSPEGIDMIEV